MIRGNKVTLIIQDFSGNEIKLDQNVLKYRSYKDMNKAIDNFIRYVNISNDRFINVSQFLNLLEDVELYLTIGSIKTIKVVNTEDFTSYISNCNNSISEETDLKVETKLKKPKKKSIKE